MDLFFYPQQSELKPNTSFTTLVSHNRVYVNYFSYLLNLCLNTNIFKGIISPLSKQRQTPRKPIDRNQYLLLLKRIFDFVFLGIYLKTRLVLSNLIAFIGKVPTKGVEAALTTCAKKEVKNWL